MKQYICTVCGYIHETEGELPDDFKCPICGAGKDAFVLKSAGNIYAVRYTRMRLKQKKSLKSRIQKKNYPQWR